MNRTYRDGFDIDVALASAFKRSLPCVLAVQECAENAAAQTGTVGVSNTVTPAPRNARAMVKAWLRKPVKALYRVARPFVRPLAFRGRAYLTIHLRDDIARAHGALINDIGRMGAETLREVQASREILRQEIHAVSQHPELDQRRLMMGILQETQSMRDMLRREIREQGKLSERQMLGAQGAILDESMAQRAFLNERIEALQQTAHTLAQEAYAQRATINALREDMQTLKASARPRELEYAESEKLDQLHREIVPRLDRIEQYTYANARRMFVSCADNEVLVRTEAGMVMCASADYAVLAALLEAGELERGTRLLIERILQAGSTFIDAGANLGLHTLAAARAMRGEGRVIAFEPFDQTRQLLEKSVWINGHAKLVEIHGVALSNQDGQMPLHLGATSGHHSLYALDGSDDHPSGKTVMVPLRRLDDMIAPGIMPTLIKIDVEGAELEVLEGARTVFAANPDVALIVEFGPSHLHRRGQHTETWLHAFTALGFEYRAIDPDSGRLHASSPAQLNAVESTNLLFARPQSPVWQRAEEMP